MPHSVPKAALYLETGSMPLEIVIKVRLIYFHTIINNSESSMLYNIFLVQWLFPCKGDWTLQVKTDLEDFELPIDLPAQKVK